MRLNTHVKGSLCCKGNSSHLTLQASQSQSIANSKQQNGACTTHHQPPSCHPLACPDVLFPAAPYQQGGREGLVSDMELGAGGPNFYTQTDGHQQLPRPG